MRLPTALQDSHQQWQDEQLRTPRAGPLHVRAHRLALSLVELGEDAEATQRQLTRWKFNPVLCHEAAAWAWTVIGRPWPRWSTPTHRTTPRRSARSCRAQPSSGRLSTTEKARRGFELDGVARDVGSFTRSSMISGGGGLAAKLGIRSWTSTDNEQTTHTPISQTSSRRGVIVVRSTEVPRCHTKS